MDLATFTMLCNQREGLMDKKTISIIGVPSDYGQTRRGVDMGPSAIRYAGVVERLEGIGHKVQDQGDIHVSKKVKTGEVNKRLLNLEEVIDVSTSLANRVHEAVSENKFPLVFGGDHSIAIGTLAGLGDYYHNLGVIWFDAHADLNTPKTTPSGNIHGMPLAVSIGIGHERLVQIRNYAPKIKAKNIIIIGARSVDSGERELIREQGIKVYTMHEIDRLGMTRVMEDALTYIKGLSIDGLHLSLDLDGLDPLYTPGVGTPVPGGMTYRESHLAMEMVQESGMLTSAEFVEVNPILDEKNKTANVAVELIGSLFGETLV